MANGETVDVYRSDWDDDGHWYAENDPYVERTRVPADLWESYQRALAALDEATETAWALAEQIQRQGVTVAAEHRHDFGGYAWSVEDGARGVCACGEEEPWTQPCPHMMARAQGDRDLCVACGVDLPYVVVPLIGGPKDGETTHHHGGWENEASAHMLCRADAAGSHNYALRRDSTGSMAYHFTRTHPREPAST